MKIAAFARGSLAGDDEKRGWGKVGNVDRHGPPSEGGKVSRDLSRNSSHRGIRNRVKLAAGRVGLLIKNLGTRWARARKQTLRKFRRWTGSELTAVNVGHSSWELLENRGEVPGGGVYLASGESSEHGSRKIIK